MAATLHASLCRQTQWPTSWIRAVKHFCRLTRMWIINCWWRQCGRLSVHACRWVQAHIHVSRYTALFSPLMNSCWCAAAWRSKTQSWVPQSGMGSMPRKHASTYIEWHSRSLQKHELFLSPLFRCSSVCPWNFKVWRSGVLQRMAVTFSCQIQKTIFSKFKIQNFKVNI